MTLIAFFVGCGITVKAGACPDDPAWKMQLLERLNAMRAAGGDCAGVGTFAPAEEPMRWNDTLEVVAAEQSAWMAEKGQLQHAGRQGEGLGERARRADYAFERVGENVAMGYVRLEHVVQAWRASAKHCSNMMDPRYTEVALACVRSTNGSWWAIALGRPRDEASQYARARAISTPTR